MALAVLACAAAAGLALYAASRAWVIEIEARPAPLSPITTPRTGGSLVPAVPALALVALAAAGAIVATRGRARLAVGALLVAAGVGMAAAASSVLGRAGVEAGWAVVAITAGVIVAGVGLVAIRLGRFWPGMGEKYERGPGRAAPGDHERPEIAGTSTESNVSDNTSDTGLWDAIDRGEDPTKT